MPVLGGLDATLHLTSILPAVRVIVCTAYTDDTMCERAHEAGAVAVVAKGGHPSEVLAAIRQAWIQAQADRAWEATLSEPPGVAGSTGQQ
jgi:DNA-binding NarL/FixJ family response regulator